MAVTMKLVGYAQTVRVLRDRSTLGASVVLFGGLRAGGAGAGGVEGWRDARGWLMR
jgi:hypothetical protein